MAHRRGASSVTDLLQGIADDIKDFLDDEVVDRCRDTERDVRRASRSRADSGGLGDELGGTSTRQ